MKKIALVLSLVMLCCFGLNAMAADTIKIGYEAWASGPDAYFGMVAIAALEDYIEEINAKGGLLGKQVELVWYDISKDFSESVNATNKLINMDHVTAIIGPDGSPFAITLGDIVKEAKVPLLPNCGAVNVTVDDNGETKPYVFRVAPVSTLQYETLAHYVYDVMGVRRVACISETTNISSVEAVQFFNECFKSLGGEIVAEESYMLNDNEFRAQITSIVQHDPEYIFMPAAAYKEVCNFAIQLSDMGYADKIKILGSDAWYNTDALAVAGKELEGCIVISALDMNDPALEPLHQKFQAKHSGLNMSLHLYALYAVNAMQFIEWAINETQSTDGPTLRDALEGCEGVSMTTGGTWYFDAQHNPVGPEFTILSVKDGAQVTLGSYSVK